MTWLDFCYLNVMSLLLKKFTVPYTNNPKNCARYSLQCNISIKRTIKINCEI